MEQRAGHFLNDGRRSQKWPPSGPCAFKSRRFDPVERQCRFPPNPSKVNAVLLISFRPHLSVRATWRKGGAQKRWAFRSRSVKSSKSSGVSEVVRRSDGFLPRKGFAGCIYSRCIFPTFVIINHYGQRSERRAANILACWATMSKEGNLMPPGGAGNRRFGCEGRRACPLVRGSLAKRN